MQTFLPHPDFRDSVRTLDRLRLGKQRVETLQIMCALLIDGYGWSNHPATRMWRGYELCLLRYQKATVEEWLSRGYKDTCLRKTADLYYLSCEARGEPLVPPFVGDPEFHRSHQSNLVRKDAQHYGPQFPGVPDNLEYIWPV